MERLAWELSVLSRAVAYKNLTGAAAHVGLSQPQLSRIIQRIETQLNVVLLDRTIKRQSTWTPLARQLAEAYLKSSRNLRTEIERMVKVTEPERVTLASLEGLIPLALTIARTILAQTRVKTVELDVHDLNRLEELYFQGEVDLLLSSREPGRKKFRYCRTLGYQSVDEVRQGDSPIRIMSSFEFGSTEARPHRKQADHQFLVSNSLAVRKAWMDRFGGIARIPSPIRKDRASGKDFQEVVLIASDSMPQSIWNALSED